MPFTKKPDFVVLRYAPRVVITGRIDHISTEVISTTIRLQIFHEGFVIFFNHRDVRAASVHPDIGAKRLHDCQLDIFSGRSRGIFLMFERDEEAHGIVVLAEGFGFRVWLDLHCYWNCHLNGHFFFVVTLNVTEKSPERRSANLFVVAA